jgi:stalled ribosome rescue protein Dom34
VALQPKESAIMSEHLHAIVWIDHSEAKIFQFNSNDVDKVLVHAAGTGRHLQHKANVTGAGHKGVDREFFERVIASLDHTGSILIAGPANAKLELKNFIGEHHSELAQRIAGVEPLDHPSDSALVALARKFFRADDWMQSHGA